MAIGQTGAIYKAFTFDGASSRTYGVYITGAAVYNAPERSVEMITIPGRNGSFAMDEGRFENITVTYPAGIAADTEADFAAAISDLRNLLCSKRGYCRLTDEYNPNEYRMAIYKSGLEVEPAQLRAGQFNITFECKPQRFLTSGETASSVSSGSTVTNPTLFDSCPLLEVVASSGGSIAIDYKLVVTLTNSPMGRVILAPGANRAMGWYIAEIDEDLLNTGDSIFIDKAVMNTMFHSSKKLSSATKANESGDTGTSSTISKDDFNIYCTINFDGMEFTYGTSSQYHREFDIAVTASDGSTGTEHVEGTVSYDGSDTITMSPSISADGVFVCIGNSASFDSTNIVAESSIMPLSLTAYIDCEDGEAYIVSNGEKYAINQLVSFGKDLPRLKAGNSTISYTGITSLKVAPRWWTV